MGFRVEGFAFGVQGLGFGVQGLGPGSPLSLQGNRPGVIQVILVSCRVYSSIRVLGSPGTGRFDKARNPKPWFQLYVELRFEGLEFMGWIHEMGLLSIKRLAMYCLGCKV